SYRRKKKIQTVPLEFSADSMAPNSPESKQAKMLHERISRLEPFDRAIVLLWLEDIPYDEIAAIVGISVKAVGVRLVRIKEKLKSL
ncbi:MAG: sigma-70 family RNA polymerase sigma factor, partial [Muribaculaceae bacterium]|nr:sigma-70 family RNA polymerase sigma factor [Muribaculaceae bacterium]